MAENIITLSGEFAAEQAQAWEEHWYQQACAWAQEQAESYLQALDEALYEQRPAGWRVAGKRERWVMTRFGEVRIQRRLYKDEEGKAHFLLDEYLHLPSRQLATPTVQEEVVKLATEIGFEKTGKVLESLTGGALSKMTIWRLLQQVGEAALAAAEEEGEAVYQRGQPPRIEGSRQVERLFMEGDGVWVRLQRANESWMEIKAGIAYEGWRALPERREGYELVGKRVYVHGTERLPFWEGASLTWAHYWDLSQVAQVVIGGDGAGWIRKGTELFPHAHWQLDGFHLARACVRAVGKEQGQALFQAMRQGRWAEAEKLWGEAPKRTQSSAQKAQRWIETCLATHTGSDWRIHLKSSDDAMRSLGSMEGNGAHLIADRMKEKGRSWSRQGALHMAKVKELVLNQEIRHWCWPPLQSLSQPLAPPPSKSRKRRDTSTWLRADVPVLYGTKPQREWVRRLRYHINGHRLN
jgi:hypothetical protein